MRDRFLTVKDVIARLNISRPKLYQMIRDGQFPAPLKIGSQTVRWPESELDAYIASLPRSTGRKAAA